MKKKFALALALLLTISVAACGNSNNAGSSNTSSSSSDSPSTSSSSSTTEPDTTEEPAAEAPAELKTYTVYAGDVNISSTIQPGDTPIGQEIERLTGVKLEVEYIVGQNEEERAGIMVAAGTYPDIILPHNVFRVFRDAGALVPINEYIDNGGDNIKKLYGDKLKQLYDENGNIYSFTQFTMTKSVEYPASAFYISNGALKLAGYPNITSVDEYFDTIRAYVAANPKVGEKDIIGFSGPAETWRLGFSILGGDKLAGFHNTGGYVFDPNNNWKASERNTMQMRHDYLKLLNDLNIEGLLDPEFLSQTYDAYTAKIASGRVVGFFDETWEVMTAFQTIRQNKLEEAYPVPMRVTYPDVKEDSFEGLSVMGTTNSFCISIDAKDPEGIFNYFERCAANDILALRYWGIEGEHYQTQDGRRYLTPEQYQERTDIKWHESTGVGLQLLGAYPTPLYVYGEFDDGTGIYDPDYAPERLETIYDDIEKGILAQYGWQSYLDPFGPRWVSPYGYGYDINLPADDDELNDIQAVIREFNPETYQQKMIMAKPGEFEGIWQELQQRFKDAGLEKLETYFTEQVQKRVQEWN